MNTKRIVTAAFASFLFAATSFAHNGEIHRGTPVEGKVTSLSDQNMEVKTDKGLTKVLFQPDTKFEFGMEGRKAKKSDLKNGDFVMVEGTKISTKEIAASEIMIHSENNSTSEHPKQ